jgi:tripartite-type tricarboxylate transporter receptor subunit TctC
MPAIPAVPTLSESVLPGIEYGAWSGVMAPAKTPPAIVEKMNLALNRALQDPALREKIVQSSAEVRGSTVQEYAAFLKTESQRWGMAIKDAGLKPE